MKKVIYCLLATVLLAGLYLGCAPAPTLPPAPPPAPAPAPAPPPPPEKVEPIVLKMVQVFPVGHPNMFPVPIFIERVNERAKGELIIEFLGGPEVIPTFDQWEALKSGIIDLNFNVAAYYYRVDVPEAMITWLSKAASPTEERETGFYDLLNQLHKEVGVYYLGRGEWESFYLWPNERVETPYDLAGLKMRSGLIYDAFLKALGAAPVTIPHPEVYTALERGLVDGFCWPMTGVSAYGWFEVTDYGIDHPFYSADFLFLANLDSFNRLPKHLQDLLIDVTTEFEPEVVELYKDVVKEEREKAIAAGVEFIKFSPADAKWYVDLAWQAGYEEAKERCRPEYFDKLMELAGW